MAWVMGSIGNAWQWYSIWSMAGTIRVAGCQRQVRDQRGEMLPVLIAEDAIGIWRRRARCYESGNDVWEWLPGPVSEGSNTASSRGGGRGRFRYLSMETPPQGRPGRR